MIEIYQLENKYKPSELFGSKDLITVRYGIGDEHLMYYVFE